MPDLDGIEATRRISRTDHAPAVVVLTMFQDDDSVLAAMKGRRARAICSRGPTRTRSCGRSARAAVEAIFGPEIAARVISHFASGLGSTGTLFPR
jgi:DNA-binding NarL/FixJ family response regulator